MTGVRVLGGRWFTGMVDRGEEETGTAWAEVANK